MRKDGVHKPNYTRVIERGGHATKVKVMWTHATKCRGHATGWMYATKLIRQTDVDELLGTVLELFKNVQNGSERFKTSRTDQTNQNGQIRKNCSGRSCD